MRHYEVVETIYKRFETADKMAEMISNNVRCVVILSTVDDKIDTIELCEKPGRKPIETKPRKSKINK